MGKHECGERLLQHVTEMLTARTTVVILEAVVSEHGLKVDSTGFSWIKCGV